MAVIMMDFFRAVLRSLCPKINRKSKVRVAPCSQNRAQNVNIKPVTNTKNVKTKPATNTKKPKDDQTRHVVVREAIQKADSTIPSTQSDSQHFIRISSKKSSVGEMNSGLDGDYASVITEFSDQISQEVAEVAEGLEVPDLKIEGRALKLPAGSRKKTKKTVAAVKPPMPQPPWVLEKKTSSSSKAHLQQLRTGVAFEVQVGTQRSEGKPAMRRKRRRATKKDLDAKQAAASQRRKELEQKLVEKLKARHEKERELKESLSKFGTRKLPPIKHYKRLVHDEIPVVFGAN